MRHRRARRYAKRERNVMWQSVFGTAQLSAPSANPYTVWKIQEIVPGMDDGSDFTPFDFQTVLQRVRGVIVHDGRRGLSPASGNPYFAFVLNMFKVPAEVASDIDADDLPNPFINGDGDDYPLYVNAVCQDGASGVTHVNNSMVDVKAKRRVDFGDRFVLMAGVRNNVSSDLTIDFCYNLRFLWELRK